jgi:hypothetical protein
MPQSGWFPHDQGGIAPHEPIASSTYLSMHLLHTLQFCLHAWDLLLELGSARVRLEFGITRRDFPDATSYKTTSQLCILPKRQRWSLVTPF